MKTGSKCCLDGWILFGVSQDGLRNRFHCRTLSILFYFFYLFIFNLIYFYFYFFFRAVPTAYESFWARGRFRAAAANLCHSHSNARSEPHLWPTLQFMAMLDPSTHWGRPGIEPASSWILIEFLARWATTGTPKCFFNEPQVSPILNIIVFKTMNRALTNSQDKGPTRFRLEIWYDSEPRKRK